MGFWKTVGGAVVGGLLGGPAGAVAGAVIGSGKAKVVLKKTGEIAKATAKGAAKIAGEAIDQASRSVPSVRGVVISDNGSWGICCPGNKILTVLENSYGERHPGDIAIIPDYVFCSRNYCYFVNKENLRLGIDIETFSKAVDRAREGEAYGVYGSEKFVMELCEMRHPVEIEQRGFHKYAIWLNKN